MIEVKSCAGKKVLIGDDSYIIVYREAEILRVTRRGFVKLKWVVADRIEWLPIGNFESDYRKYRIVEVLGKISTAKRGKGAGSK